VKDNIVTKTKERYMEYEKRHQDILDAAITLFNKRGYTATTTARIAKDAGVTEKTMYRHFSNKKDLFNECINSVVTLLSATWQEEMDKDSNDPVIYLKALIYSYVRFVIDHPDKSMFLVHLYSARDTEELDGRFSKILNMMIDEMEKAIAEMRKKGTLRKGIFPDIHPRMLAGLLISQYFSMIFLNEFMSPDLFNAETAIHLVKEMMGID